MDCSRIYQWTNEPAIAVQDTDQVVERSRDIDARDIDVPMLLEVDGDDGVFFFLAQPMISRNSAVMFVDSSVPLLPLVIRTLGNLEPSPFRFPQRFFYWTCSSYTGSVRQSVGHVVLPPAGNSTHFYGVAGRD